MIGANERNGKIRADVIQSTDSATFKGFVLASVDTGATVFTDEHSGYRGLSASFGHRSVKHIAGEYVNGMAHTNGIESFWAMLKRAYNRTYHLLAKGLDGKRLRYDDLVAAP